MGYFLGAIPVFLHADDDSEFDYMHPHCPRKRWRETETESNQT